MIFRLILKSKFIAFLLFSATIFCQEVDQEIPQLEIIPHISSQRYFTGKDGIVRIYVNVWGAVKKPGIHLVYDGIDITTLMSITGGPSDNARLSKIKLIREVPDDNGEFVHYKDFKKFITDGD